MRTQTSRHHLPRSIISSVFYLALICLFLVILGPVLWLFLNSFKTNVEALAIPPRLFVRPTFDNYRAVIVRNVEFPRFFMNSILTMVISTVVVLAFGMPASYVLARFRFRGKVLLAFVILATRMIPRVAIGIPTYMIMMKMGMLDTYFALITSYVAYNLPFGIWLLIGFIQMIPKELEEAAAIDGSTRFQAFRRIVVPLIGPGLAAVGILVMIVCWREFFLPLILTSRRAKTISVVAGQFMTEYGIDWGQLSAFAMITFAPVIAIAVYAQKYLISGLTMGAVKE
jgi:multiple sugar transport system permease protein